MREVRGTHYWPGPPLRTVRPRDVGQRVTLPTEDQTLRDYWHHIKEARDSLALATRIVDQLPP